jgi:hypothetical protein
MIHAMIHANLIHTHLAPDPIAADQGPEWRGGEHCPRSVPMR